MPIFFILSNLAVTILAGVGIFSFSGSIVYSIIGALILTGAMSSAPLFALIAYPAIELIFSDNSLSIYSALIVGITAIQMAIVFFIANRRIN